MNVKSLVLIFISACLPCFEQMSALDEDLGINSQLRYFIERGNSHGLFSITPSGTFQITHSLDREVLSSYFLTVIAVDSGDLAKILVTTVCSVNLLLLVSPPMV